MNSKPRKPLLNKSHRLILAITLSLTILVAIYCAFVLVIKEYSFNLPEQKQTVQGEPLIIKFSEYGNAGVKVAGQQEAFVKSDASLPTASTIKLLTVLIILDKLGESNLKQKQFTVTNKDMAITNGYIANNGSIVPIEVGQTISYYDALSYILVRSANNVTDIMVAEVFGTKEEFVKYANDFMPKNNIRQTVVTDPTGFAPATVSTATDLLRVAEMAVSNPTVTTITKQNNIILPNGTTASSTNLFLPISYGQLIGLKTGFTSEAGSVFIAGVALPNKDIVTSVVMGADSPSQSQSESLVLAQQIASTYKTRTVVRDNATVFSVPLPWGDAAELYTKAKVEVPIYGYQSITFQTKGVVVSENTPANEAVIDMNITSPKTTVTTPLYIRNLHSPSTVWKLMHPLW